MCSCCKGFAFYGLSAFFLLNSEATVEDRLRMSRDVR